ncbi:hypothetical protein [Paucibacter sp. Y2R2-4]|uniref:hypothetical protein n=1 Tax=Paucibacter sp. Y2R2-4 TaxID=2893553 RepID=UPI0021E48779|nr:hypothetical protein [Paucibacter sp. Y2R2-4]MCV2352382.1 hypothetical protein [Paucibacter sp. Y2R2-4]
MNLRWTLRLITRRPCVAVLACLLNGIAPAHAGRPLNTDDAGVADAGSCQIESWLELQPRTPGPRQPQGLVFAPACGVAPGWELELGYARQGQQDSPSLSQGNMGLKLAPDAWQFKTALGELNLGLRWASNHEQAPAQSWRQTQYSMTALASLALDPTWTLHANLGVARLRDTKSSATVMNWAAVWSPSERGLLFIEMQTNNRNEAMGPNSYGLGGRYWLKRDQLGLDLSANREDRTGSRVLWTVGLGWYGIGL